MDKEKADFENSKEEDKEEYEDPTPIEVLHEIDNEKMRMIEAEV